jgi:hypothetical protein
MTLTARVTALAATVSASLALLAPVSLGAESTGSGWGAQASYLGRYHLRVVPLAGQGGSGSSHADAQAAVFSAAAAACQQVLAAVGPTSGELTLFMREVKKGAPLVPSGILNLQAPGGNELVYLTYLTSSGGTRHAKINGGAFVGPVVGSFSATSTGPGMLSGTAQVEGIGTVEADYVRFSASPQP